MTQPILTNAAGVPFERPAPPPADASAELVIAYIRAQHAFNDAVLSCGSRAFTSALREAAK